MTDYFLSHGSHNSPKDGRCAMEWVSYLAGEKHSDSPKCVSPVLTRFCIRLNDRLPDDERQKLRPYLARTIGTAGDGLDEQRLQMCREWLIRHAMPYWLSAAGRQEAAEHLRSLPEPLTLEATQRALDFAASEAWSARQEARDRLTEKIRAELAKRGVAVAVAVADAVAVAVAVADAVADADADVAADADADAAAAADADADADAEKKSYWAIHQAVSDAVYEKVRARALELARERNKETIPSAFELLDRMLPTEVVQLPVVEDAEAVCGVAINA